MVVYVAGRAGHGETIAVAGGAAQGSRGEAAQPDGWMRWPSTPANRSCRASGVDGAVDDGLGAYARGISRDLPQMSQD
jgi:hypothetical protein